MNTKIQINENRLLASFLELVQIDSPSGQEQEVGEYLKKQLTDLGGRVQQDDAGNLIARFPGQGEETILLSAHMDTVGKDTGIKPVVRDGVVYSDGTTILGADDKSGVAVVLETLALFQEQTQLSHPPIEVVFSVQEEVGLVGAKKLDATQLQSSWGLIFDAGGPIGTLVYSAPSQNKLDIIVHGKKSHAGSSPEKGINAIVVAAEAIIAAPIGRIDEETTSNVGVISGGEATNIVPDRVTLRAEARSRNQAKLDDLTASMVKAFKSAAENHETSVDIDVSFTYPGYVVTPEQRPYVVAQQAIESLGFEFAPQMGGGGTDGNIYNNAGIPCVVLSTGQMNAHTREEYIAIQDMVDSTKVVVQLLTQEG